MLSESVVLNIEQMFVFVKRQSHNIELKLGDGAIFSNTEK
jgi:hypothetical protein